MSICGGSSVAYQVLTFKAKSENKIFRFQLNKFHTWYLTDDTYKLQPGFYKFRLIFCRSS